MAFAYTFVTLREWKLPVLSLPVFSFSIFCIGHVAPYLHHGLLALLKEKQLSKCHPRQLFDCFVSSGPSTILRIVTKGDIYSQLDWVTRSYLQSGHCSQSTSWKRPSWERGVTSKQGYNECSVWLWRILTRNWSETELVLLGMFYLRGFWHHPLAHLVQDLHWWGSWRTHLWRFSIGQPHQKCFGMQ